jgi:hypothetical protein
MSGYALTLVRTVESITNDLDPNKHSRSTVDAVINTIVDKITKSNMSYNEIKPIFERLDMFILTARDKGIISQELTQYFHDKILDYQSIYSEEPGQTEYPIRFIKRFMEVKSLIKETNPAQADYVLRDLFYRSRSLDMLPALKTAIEIVEAFKTLSCKDVIEYRIGAINYSNDISRESANYQDYFRLLSIASCMGWYTEEELKAYLQRCREMSAQYKTDLDGVPIGFKGNESYETLTEVKQKNVNYLDTNNFKK